jgi:glutaconate CoA-transferase subunit A
VHISQQMAEVCDLRQAISELVHDGDSVAAEGFSHLIPFAAGHEIIRQQKRDLTLIRLTPDIIYDQMIGAGCARKLIFSWAGNPGIGLSPRFRDAVENGWPYPLEVEEYSHAGLTTALSAAAAGLPFGIFNGHRGGDLLKHTKTLAAVKCPFTGMELLAVRAIHPDVTIIHAQQADRNGNVALWGVTGVQKEAVLAARRSIVTVEEIRDSLEHMPNSVVLPSWVITAVVPVPQGARPSYTQGYYARDDNFYREWDLISRDRNRFIRWVEINVRNA